MDTQGNEAITQRRIAGIDGLRGFAILLVVASHISGSTVELGGPAGVTIFFVLSGFLITKLLLSERAQRGRINLASFYWRRLTRLAPALTVLVVLVPVIMWAVADPRLRGAGWGLLASFFYVQDIVSASGHDRAVLGHTWSLAVEEQFYLLWPLSLIWLRRAVGRSRRRLAILLVGLALVFLAWHLAAVLLLGPARVYYAPDTNAGALLAGCAFAAVRVIHPGARIGGCIATVTAGLVALTVIAASRMPDPTWTIRNLTAVVVVIPALVMLDGAERSSLFRLSVLRWFGTISYGLYLWHWFLISLLPAGDDLTGMQRLAAALLSIAVAAASWYAIERPIGRWGRGRGRTAETEPGTVRSREVLLRVPQGRV